MVANLTGREIEIDALFVANAVDSPAGLAYVLGGGWTRCWPPDGAGYPHTRALPMVIMIRVPWRETNVDHRFLLRVMDADEAVLLNAEGEFKTGRDVHLTDGMSQLVTMTITAPIELKTAGIYTISVAIDGQERKRIEFEALARNPSNPAPR